MANQPHQNTPVNSTAILELIDHCPGASRYLGSVDVNIASGGFVCVTRRVDSWTEPVIYLLSLGDLTKRVSVSTIALNPTFDITAQCKILINANGQWALYHDNERVWLQDLNVKRRKAPVLLSPSWESDILLVKWSEESTATVVTKSGKVYHIDAKAKKTILNESLSNNLSFDHESVRLVDFSQGGKWSASSSVRFENGQPKGILHLNFAHSNFFLSGFTGEFGHIPAEIDGLASRNPSAQQEKNVFVYADVGPDVYSLSISAISISSNIKRSDEIALNELLYTPKWKKNFKYFRSHGLRYPDLPIAVHISQSDGFIFLVTQLSYVHVFQLVDGSHLGSTRVSNFKISSSLLCKERLGLILVDANGIIFQVKVDIQSWISRLNISSANPAVKLHALRLAIQFEVSFTKEFYSQFLTNLDNGISKDALELMGQLSGNQLLKLFTKILKQNPTLVPSIRLLAKNFLEKIPMSDLIALFKTQGGASGVFSFLNMIELSNLKGDQLVEYLESAVEGKEYGALTSFLLQAKVSNPDVVKQTLEPIAHYDPKTAALFQMFCDRFDFVEDLIKFCAGTESLDLAKRVFEKFNGSQVLRAVKALLEHNVDDAVLNALFVLAVKLQPSTFTPDLLALFRCYNRLNICINGLEILATEPKSDNRFVHLLLDIYQEEEGNYDMRKTEFIKKIGSARCAEIGQTLEKADYRLALTLYKISECDRSYIKLALEHCLFHDVALYLVIRADTQLWVEVLVSEQKADITRIFHTAEFQSDLLWCPFSAIKVLVQLLTDIDTDGTYASEALFIADYLSKISFQPKAENAFYQEITLNIWIKSFPEEQTKIGELLVAYKDYNHVKILVELLAKKMIGPAKLVISRLTEEKRMTEEVTESDIDTLTSMTSSCDEGGLDMAWLWIIIGNMQLARQKLYETILVHIKARHVMNYVDVLRAIKETKKFDHWDLAIVYLKMVERSVKDTKVNAALSIALARANRFDDLEKLLENSSDPGFDQQSCVICEDAPKEIHFLPCHHVCACSKCADGLITCPICRIPIADKLRVYFS